MKLQHFASPVKEAQKLRDLGKALQPAPKNATMIEAKKPAKVAQAPVEMDDAPGMDASGMDAAIHMMTQDRKHLHTKLAHHD